MLKFTVVFLSACHILIAGIDTFNFETESNQILRKYLDKLKKEEKIYPSGVGGGSLGEINLISIYWDSARIVNIDEARRLIINAAEQLFSVYNDNKKLRPYLHHYPFGIESVDLHIGFNTNVNDPKQVSYVSLGNKTINYYDFDLEILCGSKTETFEEASRIVHAQLLMKGK